MKKILILNILFALMFSVAALAQDEQKDEDEETEEPVEFMVPQNSFVKRTVVKNKKPMEYAYVSEDDAFWQTVIWRIIDCREKMNYPLYYPTVELDTRKSLIQTLVAGIQKKRIQAYAGDDDNFKTKLTPEEVMTKFDAGDKVIKTEKIDGTGDTTYIVKNSINWQEVREFMLKEEWFFDKKRSVMEVRILGICPIRVYNKMINTGGEEEAVGQEVRTRLFWVYFPEARRVLANTICYTGRNELANISYDDLMHKRRFASRIIAESNNLNDRRITDYVRNGIEAVMESDRIQYELLKRESDHWEY
ncbi:MAG: gliding motility protein GldN [Prevotellaceae bacterium]|nr:gliding motility protein GldN [Prevotellaceae bacterium]